MGTVPTITIDMDKKCAECGKGGAVGNGLCLSCTTKAIRREPMKTATGKAVQRNALGHLDAARRK